MEKIFNYNHNALETVFIVIKMLITLRQGY